MIASRSSVLLITALAVYALPARAQWWSRAPADFEECADAAEKVAIKEAKASALIECNAKFAGRRKPGGGYTYFDFMQNRSFDIAGPNPTRQEQKHIDEQYTVFLDRERQNSIAAAFTAKQQQLQQASLRNEQTPLRSEPAPLRSEKASLRNEQAPLRSEKVPVPAEAPKKPVAAANDIKPRAKPANCANHSFSCDWPRLSESIKDLKKLFGGSPSKPKRG